MITPLGFCRGYGCVMGVRVKDTKPSSQPENPREGGPIYCLLSEFLVDFIWLAEPFGVLFFCSPFYGKLACDHGRESTSSSVVGSVRTYKGTGWREVGTVLNVKTTTNNDAIPCGVLFSDQNKNSATKLMLGRGQCRHYFP